MIYSLASGCRCETEPHPQSTKITLNQCVCFLVVFLFFQSQQKCIVIFALVCCFAVLVALIFSAVDVLGEDEDILNGDNCSNICQ